MNAFSPADIFGGFNLRKGDNDRRRIWGGVQAPAKSSSGPGAKATSHVQELQSHLKFFGAYTLKVDGDFGKGTDAALRRYQYNAKNFTRRLKAGKVVDAKPTFTGEINGRATLATRQEIVRWLRNKHVATGDLIRVRVDQLTNVTLGPYFKHLENPSLNKGELLISDAFLKDLEAMNTKAAELKIKVSINQALRIAGKPVSGAVVKPASKSQHLIGHAIDCNLVDGSNWNSKKTFTDGNQSEGATKFIASMKARGMRWGGDWKIFDTPHFDRQLSASTDAFDHKYFFNQRVYSLKQPVAIVDLAQPKPT